jgi:hypothetical protein
MVKAIGFLWLAAVVWAFVVLPALRELRVRARRRAIARDLDALPHVLSAQRDRARVQGRARVTAVSYVPAGQSRMADHDDAA